MNEQQAALDFFSQPENLPLALIAAEHIDDIRQRLNNEFWEGLREQLDSWTAQQGLAWDSAITEDRNNDECLVGLHAKPQTEQRVFLIPFMEQQFLGGDYRMFVGLMWNTEPDVAQKNQPAVAELRSLLVDAGFSESDTFLAWQWLPWHPRRRDFLMQFSQKRDELLAEAMQPWQLILGEFGELLKQANAAVNMSGTSTAVSLDQLRSKLPSQSAAE